VDESLSIFLRASTREIGYSCIMTQMVRRSRKMLERDAMGKCGWVFHKDGRECQQPAMVEGFCYWHIRTAVRDPRTGLELNLEDIDPRALILEEIARSSWTVRALEEAFQGLDPAELATVEINERRDSDAEGQSYTLVRYEPRMHPIIEALRKEREHGVQVARAAMSAGIEERYVRLAEGQADTIVTAMMLFMRELGLDTTDPAHRAAAARALEAARGGITGGDGEAGTTVVARDSL
jgi:hypothetical protein